MLHFSQEMFPPTTWTNIIIIFSASMNYYELWFFTMIKVVQCQIEVNGMLFSVTQSVFIHKAVFRLFSKYVNPSSCGSFFGCRIKNKSFSNHPLCNILPKDFLCWTKRYRFIYTIHSPMLNEVGLFIVLMALCSI